MPSLSFDSHSNISSLIQTLSHICLHIFDDPDLKSVPPYSFCPISIYFAYCSEINYRVLISNYHSPSRIPIRTGVSIVSKLQTVLLVAFNLNAKWLPNIDILSHCSPSSMACFVKLRSGYPILVKSP